MVVEFRLLGYWRNDDHPEYPDPKVFVDESWDPDERNEVEAYLAGGTFTRHFMGRSPCRLCQQPNGTSEVTDGTYAWPEGLGHYVGEHSVRLPLEFVQHVQHRVTSIETAHHNLAWWLAVTA